MYALQSPLLNQTPSRVLKPLIGVMTRPVTQLPTHLENSGTWAGLTVCAIPIGAHAVKGAWPERPSDGRGTRISRATAGDGSAVKTGSCKESWRQTQTHTRHYIHLRVDFKKHICLVSGLSANTEDRSEDVGPCGEIMNRLCVLLLCLVVALLCW